MGNWAHWPPTLWCLWTTAAAVSDCAHALGMNDIPPLTHPDDMPPVHTQADLWRHWRALMGPLGFSERLLWVILLTAEGRVTPVVQQVEDLPRLPDPGLLDPLMSVIGQVCGELGEGTAAVLLSRPGGAGITPAGRTWAQQLSDAAAAADVRLWPVHLANDDELVTLSPDDLALPRAAAG